MRKNGITILGLFFLFNNSLRAGDGEYAVSKIPFALLKNANVIKRAEDIRFEVMSFTRTREYNKFAITILNDRGDEFAYLYEYYDMLRSVKSIEGKLFDANGKEIKSLKNRDIEDRSGVSWMSLMEDTRFKVHNFYCKTYPYTIEYEVITEYNNTYFFPRWYPQPDEKYAVQKSTIQISCPFWFGFKYKMYNYNESPVIAENGKNKSYTWEVNNMPAIISEYAVPDLPFLTTCVYFSPDKFMFGGYSGTMSSWKGLGEFQLQLNKDRDVLPAAVKQKVHELTDGITNKKEKIKVLYEFLQKNTRYVSIQLGIGGWQPYDATYVATKSYGDCKALSNYMYALLKEINIKSCYTLINAGKGRYFFAQDFPSLQFNHIILCVPLQKDTVWLECTSQTLPAGYLSSFTCNRFAIAVDENGGKLVRTPKYGMNENLQSRSIKAVQSEGGTLNVIAHSKYSGLQQDEMHWIINSSSKEKVKEYLLQEFELSAYNINMFNYTEQKGPLPAINESLDITVSNYATITGKRIFIVPNIMTRSNRKLSLDSTRKYDIQLDFEYKDVDSVEIELPKGYEVEAMPKDVTINSQFGKYSSSIKLKDNKLYYYRSIEHNSGRYPAKEYKDLVEFYGAIYKADHNKVVLVKRNG